MPRVAATQLEASHLDPEAGLRRIEEGARAVGATLVVGVSERDPNVRGRLWNTGVVVDDQGNCLGKHRKLVGVMHEIEEARLVWNHLGDDTRDDLFGLAPSPAPAATYAAAE